MELLSIIALVVIVVSLVADRRKTWIGIKQGIRMFLRTLPPIISVLILVSIVLSLLPNELIIEYLGDEAGFSGHFCQLCLSS
jgi:hypothetical protein